MNTPTKIQFKTRLQTLLSPLFKSGFGTQFSIGLDIGFDRLNLVQMDYLAGKPHIRAIASIPFTCSRELLLSDSNQLKTLLKQAYSTQPFKGKSVVSCLPAEQFKIITISYKQVEGQTDEEAVVAELRERYKGELDNLIVDFMTLRQDDTDSVKRDVLVAVASREKVVSYLDWLTNAGLNVEALDIGPAALTRLVCHSGAIHVADYPKLPNVLLINFGASASFLTIIWGRRLMLDRPIDFSENRIFSRMKQVLDMPEHLMIRLLYEGYDDIKSHDDLPNEITQMVTEVLRPEISLLLQEVNKTLIYMASKTRGKSVDQIYLTGRVARYSGIINYLREQLQVPVDILDPVQVFASEKHQTSGHTLGTMAGMAMTTGLALRGVPEHG